MSVIVHTNSGLSGEDKSDNDGNIFATTVINEEGSVGGSHLKVYFVVHRLQHM